MRRNWTLFVLVIVAALLLFIRLTAYEPLGYSVSTPDTQRFITAGRIPFFSGDFFTSDIPPTASLVYKILEPATGYQIAAFASPAENIYQAPFVQPGLQRVALVQGLLSIGAWLLLAFVIVRCLRNSGLQVIVFLLILAFGFSPSVAEWDVVQLSESISLSLFVIFLSLSVGWVDQISNEPSAFGTRAKTLMALFSLALLLWVFARDTNAYILPVFIIVLALFLVLTWWKKLTGLKSQTLITALAALTLLFIVQNVAMQHSGRWMNSFFNNLLHNVFPYPDRVDFFKDRGMPISDEVWALRNSPGNEDGFFEIPELMAWTTENGARTYMQFMLFFPRWTFGYFFSGVETSFSENRQPFFSPNENRTTLALSYVGDLLHPQSSSVIWIALAELAIFGFLAFRRGQLQSISLFFLFLTMFLGEILMLFVSILGDPIGVVRHAMGSATPLRLSVWLLPPFILDLYALPNNESKMSSRLRRPAATKRRPRKA